MKERRDHLRCLFFLKRMHLFKEQSNGERQRISIIGSLSQLPTTAEARSLELHRGLTDESPMGVAGDSKM